jgi:hypothetical protein
MNKKSIEAGLLENERYGERCRDGKGERFGGGVGERATA